MKQSLRHAFSNDIFCVCAVCSAGALVLTASLYYFSLVMKLGAHFYRLPEGHLLFCNIMALWLTGWIFGASLKVGDAKLLPGYWKHQSLATAVSFAVLALVDAALVWFFLPTPRYGFILAVWLLFAALALWDGFLYSKKPVVAVLAGVGIVLLAASLKGVPVNGVEQGLGAWLARGGAAGELCVAAASLAAVAFFFLYCAKAAAAPPPLKPKEGTASAPADWCGLGSARMASVMAGRLARKQAADGRVSVFRLARLVRYGIFSPVTAVGLVDLLLPALYLLNCLVVQGTIRETGNEALADIQIATMCVLYIFGPSVLLLDFLRHQDRLPGLYLRSRCASRKIFGKAVFCAYGLAAARQLAVLTLGALAVHALVPWAGWGRLLWWLGVGLAMGVGQAALPLLSFARRNRLSDDLWWGFLMASLFALLVCRVFAPWGMALLVGGALLLVAIVRRRGDLEMDFREE